MKKIIVLLLLLVTFTGCTSNELEDNYNKMQMSDELTGYSLRVKVSGMTHDSFTVRNYNNEQYELETDNEDVEYNYLTREYDGETTLTYYVIEDIVYELVDDERIESEYDSILNNTNIYLECLTSNSGVEQLDDKELGTTTYNVYEIDLKKSTTKDLLEYLALSTEYEEAIATVLIGADGYVYSIEYNIDSTNIYAYYSKFNSIREIDIEEEAGIIEEEYEIIEPTE